MPVAWPSWSKALDLSLFLIPNGRKSARVRTSPPPVCCSLCCDFLAILIRFSAVASRFTLFDVIFGDGTQVVHEWTAVLRSLRPMEHRPLARASEKSHQSIHTRSLEVNSKTQHWPLARRASFASCSLLMSCVVHFSA